MGLGTVVHRQPGVSTAGAGKASSVALGSFVFVWTSYSFPALVFRERSNFPSLFIIWFQHVKDQFPTCNMHVFKLRCSLSLVLQQPPPINSAPQSPFSSSLWHHVTSVWGIPDGPHVPLPQVPHAWRPPPSAFDYILQQPDLEVHSVLDRTPMSLFGRGGLSMRNQYYGTMEPYTFSLKG